MIALEVLPDVGAPQLGITVSGMGAGGTITVQVSWDDGYDWHGVRGAENVEVLGDAAFFRDFVPPLNTDVIYRVIVHAGDPGAATEAETFIPSSSAWIQDPINPRQAVAIRADLSPGGVLLSAGSLASATWSQAVDYGHVEGARAPVASIGQRLIAGEVPLRFATEMASDGGLLRRLLMDSGPLVLRGLDSDLLEPVATVAVGSASERRIGASAQIGMWDLVARQVRPPSMRVLVPWWTYDQVKALWGAATYADALAARPGDTYLSWLRTPEVP